MAAACMAASPGKEELVCASAVFEGAIHTGGGGRVSVDPSARAATLSCGWADAVAAADGKEGRGGTVVVLLLSRG